MSKEKNYDSPPKKTTNVFVLYTGGTFGMTKTGPSGSLSAMELHELKDKLQPELFDLGASNDFKVNVELDDIQPPIDSSSMKPSHWVQIAKRIEEKYEEYDGFIIIQGTDTLSYTASALSFMFQHLAKPVIVTGSQLPLESARSDGRLNYGHALKVAAYKATDLPKICEVVVVFADKILRGCRTRKMSASAWTGFNTPNCPPLGEIGEHLRIYENQLRPEPAGNYEFQTITDLEEGVLDVAVFPGLKGKTLSTILEDPDIRGVVLRTYGTGNATDDDEFLAALSDATGIDGKTIINITQCPQGMVEMGLYQASVGLVENGLISGMDMTPEAALTKLMVTLKNRTPNQIKLQMQVDQRGEQTYNLFDLRFAAPKEPFNEKFSGEATPDRRFDPLKLSIASLRILEAKFESKSDDAYVDIFMNDPAISRKSTHDERIRSRVARITVKDVKGGRGTVVRELAKEQTLRRIGDSYIELSFVTSDEDTFFSCQKLALALQSQA